MNTTSPTWLTEGWEHIWKPYTQMQTVPFPMPVARTEGCRIILEDGRELVDGTASWWSAMHGYNHPHIINAMKKQLDVMPHVMFGGLAHEQAYRLATRLCKLAPGRGNKKTGLTRCFFSDSGSTATEVAMKMALQYWRNQGNVHKDRFVCFSHGYHGDTLGAMSVSDPAKSMHKAFKNLVPKHYVLDIPNGEYGFAELDETFAAISRQTAAVIIEPLVQCAGGMKFHSPDSLAEIYRLAKKHNILFIADEVATGFCRTGNLFACDEAGIVPDIMCLGKGLTGGTMTLAATLTTADVFEAFSSDDEGKALMHGPTFMANPLACSAANASLDLIEREPYLTRVFSIEHQMYQALNPLGELAGVVDVRIRGAIAVLQLSPEFINVHELRTAFLKENTWIRPIEDVVYIMPPLTISDEELAQLTTAIGTVLERWSHNVRKQLSHLFD